MELPKITFPPGRYNIDICCGRETYISRVQVEVKFLDNPPKTINRYVTISRWQCQRTDRHSGYSWVTTNWRLDEKE